MKLINNSKNALMHSLKDKNGKNVFYLLKVGEIKEIPNEIAEIWLKHPGVKEHVTAEDVEAIKAKAVAEALKEERAKQAKAKAVAKKGK